MPAKFDFRKFVADTIRENTIGLAEGMVDAVGYQITNTIKTVSQNAITTIEGIPDRLQSKLEGLPGDIANIAVAPGLSIEQMVGALANPNDNKDDFTRSLEAFTGVNMNQLTGFSPRPREVQARLNEFAAALKTQIMLEIKNCIEKYIRGIINKNLDLFELINFETYIAGEIAKLRSRVKFKIQGQIENYLYDKLKIQQVALFKQKILQSIQKVCPASKTKFTSPTLTRRLQSDRTWEVAESGSSIQETASTKSLELMAKADTGESTGQDVIDAADEAVAALGPMAQQQALGYDDNVIGNFVNLDGSAVTV